MLQIDKFLNGVDQKQDIIFVTSYGEGADIIYVPESGNITNFFDTQKINTPVRVENIIVAPRLNLKGKTIINNIGFNALKKEFATKHKSIEIIKAIPKIKNMNKIRIFDTSAYINEVISFAHTKTITSVFSEFFKTIFTSNLDFERTSKPAAADATSKRPKVLLIDHDPLLASNHFTIDFSYFLKMSSYNLQYQESGLLPDSIIYKIGNVYYPIGFKHTDKIGEITKEYIKINRIMFDRVLKIIEDKDTSLNTVKKVAGKTEESIKILGFNKEKTLSQIENIDKSIMKIRDTSGGMELTKNIKKYIEGDPNLEDLQGKTFEEKLNNLHLGLKHAEKIRETRGVANIIDPEKEETLKKDTEAAEPEKATTKFITALTDFEKELVQQYNGTVFLDSMKERSNFNIRAYNPDNIIGLTEFNGYKKQDTEFRNNLDDAINDLIKSLEKDPDLKIKVIKVDSEIKDDNKTRYKEFTAQIQHAEFGNTYNKKYSIKFIVPYPIEGKYLKIGGNDYVMVNQLFNKPIQKVNNQLVRLYTHYNTSSITLKNSKFNGVYGLMNIEKELIVSLKNSAQKLGLSITTEDFLSENHKFFDFMPKSTKEKFKFNKIELKKSGFSWKLDFNQDRFYESKNGESIEYANFDYETKEVKYFIDGDLRTFPIEHLDEFLLGMYNKLSKLLLKEDIIKKSKSSVPFVSARIVGKQCPIAVMLVCMEDFAKAMTRMELRWSFQEKKIITKEKDHDQMGIGGEPINIQTKNGFITIYPKTFKQRILAAGLNRMKVKDSIFDPNSNSLYDAALANEMGQIGYLKFKEAIPKIIDNTTEKVLKEYGYPVDILTLYSDTMVNLLTNREESHFENLDHYRIRLSETISHIGYKQLQQAMTELKRKKTLPDQKLFIKRDFIMSKLLEAGIFQNAKTINPIEEMMLSQKIVKTGIGNVKKEQVTLQRRDLNPSYFGVISPTATNEYGGIGSNQTLTNGTLITDRFGSIKTKAFNNDDNPFKMLSPVESLTPFFEYDDTTRRIMGNQQTGQFTQLENPDEPLTQTGFESYVPWLVSDRFTKKAQIQGQVSYNKDNNIITINGTGPDVGKIQKISLKHAKSRTKRGVYLLNKYTMTVSDGQNVKPNTIIAATDSLKSGKLAVGKNVVIAEMPYNGMNYEDGWVITGAIQSKYTNKYLQKLTILVPDKVKITRINLSKNQMTNPGDVLFEFQKEDYYVQNLNLDNEHQDEDDVLFGLEQHRGTSKYYSPGGKIAEIVVKLNTNKTDPKIKALWDASIKDLKELQSQCEIQANKLGDPKARNHAMMDCMGNTDGISSLTIGGHKISGEEPGTGIIEVYIERENPINNGSKFTLGNSGGKGTVQYIIPAGLEPYAQETGLKIEFIPTSLSIIKRKNPSIYFNMYLSKCWYFANEIVKTMIKEKPDDIQRVKNFILDGYRIIDKTENQSILKEHEAFFNLEKSQIIKAINQSNSLSKPLFVGVVPPFMNKIKMRDIVLLAKHIGIPLKEKIVIPENDGTTTLKKVPVGILNVFLLEHFPHTQGSVRGSQYIKSSIVTGQGSSGSKDRKGATKAGLYDLYSILTKTPYNLIKELHSLKSDAKMAKVAYQRQIFNGDGTPSISHIKITKDDTTTKNYLEALLLGAGLRTFY